MTFQISALLARCVRTALRARRRATARAGNDMKPIVIRVFPVASVFNRSCEHRGINRFGYILIKAELAPPNRVRTHQLFLLGVVRDRRLVRCQLATKHLVEVPDPPHR
jgi:hypothetical protein